MINHNNQLGILGYKTLAVVTCDRFEAKQSNFKFSYAKETACPQPFSIIQYLKRMCF